MSSDRLRLFHLSDIHFGLEDRGALAWVRDEIAAKRPAAVVITGDHTMRARHHEFAAATRWIAALDVPVTISIGNHDMPYFNLVERFFDPYKRFEGMKTLVEREIDLPGLATTVAELVDTARAGRLQPAQQGGCTLTVTNVGTLLHQALDTLRRKYLATEATAPRF